MKAKTQMMVMAIVTIILTVAAPIISNACGFTFGEEPVPEMLRK